MSEIDGVGVVGGGTMGNGIAHVFAQNGHPVVLVDVDRERVDAALGTIRKNLERQARKGVIEESAVEETVGRIQPLPRARCQASASCQAAKFDKPT